MLHLHEESRARAGPHRSSISPPPSLISPRPRLDLGSRWDEYRTVLNGVRAAGFHPFYVKQQVGAVYLKVQEGSTSLHSAYEVSYGNSM